MDALRNYVAQLEMETHRTKEDFIPDGDLSKLPWLDASSVSFDTSYFPEIRYPEVRTEVRSVWSPSSIYFAFRCPYETLNVYHNEDPLQERWELWRRDVAEIFINPYPERMRHYWEFEVAPNNQWIDLEIDLDREPFHDAGWDSGFLHATSIDIESKVWSCELRIPVSCFGLESIAAGDTWRVNFFRCDGPGNDHERRFLAWSPTGKRNFHVPERFGRLVFRS